MISENLSDITMISDVNEVTPYAVDDLLDCRSTSNKFLNFYADEHFRVSKKNILFNEDEVGGDIDPEKLELRVTEF